MAQVSAAAREVATRRVEGAPPAPPREARDRPVDGGRAAERPALRPVFLALLLTLHFGSAVAHALGRTPPSAPVGAFRADLPGLLGALAGNYLDMTATRQRWSLLARPPAEWSPSVRMVAYRLPARSPTSPAADTLEVDGATAPPSVHLANRAGVVPALHRGREGWADFYRPFFLGYVCRSLGGLDAPPVVGLELLVEWRRAEVPWEADDGSVRRLERTDTFACPVPPDARVPERRA